MRVTLLHRIDAHDRALFQRVIYARTSSRRSWTALSHVGGARLSVALCIAPWVFGVVRLAVSWRALLALGMSHAIVQVVKRSAGRTRPAHRLSLTTLIHEPDRFSFPSGHACAAMAVAASFALPFPWLAVPLYALALLVGVSRVVLGVHYPGDVVVGQLIALGTAYAVFAWP